MIRPIAGGFVASTLVDQFGSRFTRERGAFLRCSPVNRARFRCQVAWISGRNIYAGVVSPFYARRSGAVIWDSHFQIDWGVLKCLRDRNRARHCPIRRLSG
jgi:hypothetical protein